MTLVVVAEGRGATLRLLLARAIASRPISEERTLAIATLRRALAVGYDPGTRTNLLARSGAGTLSEDELSMISGPGFSLG